MSKVMWAGVLAAAFYGHGRFVFSEPSLAGWLQDQQGKEMRTEDGFCKAYSDKLVFTLHGRSAQGPFDLEGDKEAYCEHIKDAVAALRVAQGSLNVERDLVSVDRAGFPWLTATVNTRETVTMRIGNLPPLTEVSDNVIVVQRGLSGRQIASIDSNSRMQVGR